MDGNIIKLHPICCQRSGHKTAASLSCVFGKYILGSVLFAAWSHLEFTAQTRPGPICLNTRYSDIRHVFFSLPTTSASCSCRRAGGPRHRHKSSSERCKDYFHSSRAVPLMRLTQKWTRHYMARHWHDRMGLLFFIVVVFFRLLDEPRLYFLSWHTGISTASSCTSLRFTVAGSLDGPAAPIASLLMDLHTGFFSCM